ncbi:MAG: DUF348 domain-containing protein [Clostridia bacterium]|nr:DUF348 domain-containing protein [Clostridia bacterium]
MSQRTKEHIRRWIFGLPMAVWVTCLTTVCLAATSLFLYVNTNLVTITNSDGQKTVVFAQTIDKRLLVREIADMRCSEDDIITYDQAKHGYGELHVEHAFPVTILVDGEKITENLIECTVADALDIMGVTLSGDDYTEPALTAKIESASSIAVHRVTYNDYTKNETVPFETQYQYTSLFYRSPERKMVMQNGADGVINAKLRDKVVDGEIVETSVIEDYGSTEAVPEIIKVYGEGAAVSSMTAPEGVTLDENGIPTQYSAVLTMKATGYYSAAGKGASGLGLSYGTFAVDPKVIPYGTRVYIASADGKFVYGWAMPTDTGSFIHTNNMQVDLFYETYEESYINAVQEVKVYIVG